MKKILLSTVAVLAMSGIALAGPGVIETNKPIAIIPHDAPVYGSFYTMGLKVGTLGVGVDVSMPLSRHFNLRANVNGLTYTQNLNDIIKNNGGSSFDAFGGNADGKINFLTAGLLIDWYPFETSDFFMSAGVYYNANKLSMIGDASNSTQTFDINGVTYNGSELGSVTGDLIFGNKIAPYIGLGWGNRGDEAGWSWSFEIGGLYQDIPTVSLDATLGTVPPGSTITQATIDADVSKEVTKVNNDISNNDISKFTKIYPVISFGITYSF